MSESDLDKYKEKVRRKLAELSAYFARITGDDFSLRIDPDAVEDDEFAAVFRSLNFMMEKLEIAVRRSVAELAQANEQLKLDLIERRRAEEELFKARKLESLGVLAGGIAHDFNNFLTGIIANLFMAKMNVKEGEENYGLIAEAEKAAFRASKLTKQLLIFSKGGAPVKEPASMRELIEDAIGFCLSGSTVDHRCRIAGDLCRVNVDRGQIDQVLNNLIINAVQAMPGGGTMTVNADTVSIGADQGKPGCSADPLAPGRYARVSIIDEGIGIPEKDLEKIFDPYFTTKQDGCGLGLTAVYSIIRKHGGHIKAESTVGKGTCITFYLPEADPHDRRIVDGADALVKGKGTVLVMDDDETVRLVIKKVLSSAGYDVDCASHGVEAIRLYKKAFLENAPYQVVVMDLTIPGGMGGKETVGHLLEIDPDANVMVFSGYSNDPILAHYNEYGFKGVIAKPFKVDEFTKAIEKMMMHKE